MIELIFLTFIAVIFIFLYRKDREDRIREENMFKNSLDQIEANTEKFYDTVGKMQIKHFENLEKHSAKLLKLIEQKPAKEIPVPEIRKLEDIYTNDIEKEQITEDPFTEENHIPIVQGLNVQMEGEEMVHPINIE